MSFHTRFKPPKVDGLTFKAKPLNPVQMQYKELCNVNNIVQRAMAGDTTVFRPARCVDLSDAPTDLHTALQMQVEARNAYFDLPDKVRSAYPTPEQFFAAVHDEKEADKLRELGVLNPKEVDTPVKVEITNPVTAAQAAE